MHRFFQAIVESLETRLNDLKKAIDGLPPEALDWSPCPEMNSLTVIITHATGSTRYWLSDFAGGIPTNRVRAEEFAVRGQSVEQLAARIDGVSTVARDVLERLTLDDLVVERAAPSRGTSHLVGWGVVHALDHLSEHVGHAQIMRQLWDQRAV